MTESSYVGLAEESDLVAMAQLVCEDMGKPVPEVTFRWSGSAYCFHDDAIIRLPSRDWIVEYQTIDHPDLYRSLLLHELAHWFMGPDEGHSAMFYKLLFNLCEGYGLDVDLVLKDETGYRKRNAPAGYRAYLASKEVSR